jgi:hypothetical protein
MVRAMTYKMNTALIASLSVVALMLAADDQTFARSGAGRGGVLSARAISHPFFRHHPRNFGNFGGFGAFWPGDFDNGSYGPSGEPTLGTPQATSSDIRYTQTYDVPWDWAHRFPPNVTPSDRPYVSSCPVETLTFHQHDGADKTVNVMRCY